MRTQCSNGEEIFGVHEVYSDDEGLIFTWSAMAVEPVGETVGTAALARPDGLRF